MFYLTEAVKISSAVTPTNGAAGTSEIDGTGLAMDGFPNVLMLVRFGTITAGAVTSIKAQQSSDNGGTDDYSDIAGTAQTVADTDDDKHFYIDLRRPTKRYVRLVVLRGTQNAVVAGATYVQYGADSLPTTQGTGVSGEQFTNPDEGTA